MYEQCSVTSVKISRGYNHPSKKATVVMSLPCAVGTVDPSPPVNNFDLQEHICLPLGRALSHSYSTNAGLQTAAVFKSNGVNYPHFGPSAPSSATLHLLAVNEAPSLERAWTIQAWNMTRHSWWIRDKHNPLKLQSSHSNYNLCFLNLSKLWSSIEVIRIKTGLKFQCYIRLEAF